MCVRPGWGASYSTRVTHYARPSLPTPPGLHYNLPPPVYNLLPLRVSSGLPALLPCAAFLLSNPIAPFLLQVLPRGRETPLLTFFHHIAPPLQVLLRGGEPLGLAFFPLSSPTIPPPPSSPPCRCC